MRLVQALLSIFYLCSLLMGLTRWGNEKKKIKIIKDTFTKVLLSKLPSIIKRLLCWTKVSQAVCAVYPGATRKVVLFIHNVWVFSASLGNCVLWIEAIKTIKRILQFILSFLSHNQDCVLLGSKPAVFLFYECLFFVYFFKGIFYRYITWLASSFIHVTYNFFYIVR